MSRKVRKSVKNIWSLGSNAFYTLYRTLLYSQRQFPKGWVFHFLQTGFICPNHSDCFHQQPYLMWWGDLLSAQHWAKSGPLTVFDDEFGQAVSTTQRHYLLFKCHTSVKNLRTGKNTLILLHLITGIEAEMLLSSWGNCKPPNHPKLRNTHRIFYYGNLQMCFFYCPGFKNP